MSCTTHVVRFVLWLFAALSFADLAPAIADPSRASRMALVREAAVVAVSREVALAPVFVADAASDIDIPKVDSSPDALPVGPAAELSTPAGRVPSFSRRISPAGDGGLFAAFQSRAPPGLFQRSHLREA